MNCNECNKKINLFQYKCKCRNLFCIKCLGDHNCTFDYLKENKDKLKLKMPLVIANKIVNKI